jgi:hypothetical protein
LLKFVGISPVEEAFQLFQRAITSSKDASKILIEYCSAASHYGSSRHKLAAIAFCEQYAGIHGQQTIDALEKLRQSNMPR